MKVKATRDITALPILKATHILLEKSDVPFTIPLRGEVQHALFKVSVPEMSLETTLKIIAENDGGDPSVIVTCKNHQSIFGLRGWRMRMEYGLILKSNGKSIPDAVQFYINQVSNRKRDVVNR